MVKTIATKRTSKNITIEQYLEEKAQKNKNSQKQSHAPRYVNLDRRYRYVRPTQKLKDIDVNVAHYINEIRILPYSHEVDNIGSFFYDELDNAKFMDLTPDFQAFYEEVYDVTQNLALILHNLEQIVNKVLEYLDKKDCRKTILQVLPGLFRDTQKEIFKLFITKILPKLIDIMNQKELNVMEDLFKCLAYALKYLYDEIKSGYNDFYALYIDKFFSSHNKHIQRFTTESLSFVLRKLKGSEIENFIEITMKPLINPNNILDESLLASHIAKLLFYSIKNHQETYTSKSLSIIENILKFALKNNLNQATSECILGFIKEILIHSRPKDDKPQDEFQEKILISKSNLFEHFTKVFLQWVNTLENVQENIGKIELICEVCTEMLVYHKGNLVNQSLLRSIFSIVKELETLYNSDMIDEEIASTLKKRNFTVIAKLLKYKESELLKEKAYVEFLDEKVKKGIHSDEIINYVFQRVIEESDKNISHRDFMKEEEFLVQNYTLKRYSYDVLLHLILQNFTWEKIVNLSDKETPFLYLHNLYLFFIIHKYTNRRNKIQLQSEKYKVKSEFIQSIQKLTEQIISSPLISSDSMEETDPNYIIKYLQVLLFVKCFDLFEVDANDREAIYNIFIQLNQALYEKLQEKASERSEPSEVSSERLYELPDAFRRQFEYDVFRKDQVEFTIRELLLTLKGEIISKIGLLSKDKNPKELSTIIEKEFIFMYSNKNHVDYIRSFHYFLDEMFIHLKNNLNAISTSSSPAFVVEGDQVYLSLEKYEQYIEKMAINLCNPVSSVRRYTLEILTKIQSHQFPELSNNNESKIVGKCDALKLCLEIESVEAGFENEREKILQFTKLKTYSDFKRIPQAYVIPLLNFYIGSFYVRYITLWEHAKENLVSILKFNDRRIYSRLKEQIIYLNCVLNPRVILTPRQENIINASFLNDGQIGQKSLLNVFLDDYYTKSEHVIEEDVFKNLLDGISKHSKIIENNFSDFRTIFLNFLGEEYYKTFENELISLNIESIQAQAEALKNSKEQFIELCCNQAIEANKEKDNLFKKCRHFGNMKLEVFLKLFTSIQKLQSLSEASALYSTFLTFLRKGHVAIQKHALECLLKFEREEVTQHAEILRKFIKPESYRDQMIQFKLDKETTTLTEAQRKAVVPLLIGILYPKLFEKKGKNKKSHLDANRTNVFIFFSSLEADEVRDLMAILFRNYGMPWENVENISMEALMIHLSKLSVERVVGFMETLQNLIAQLGVIVYPYIPTLFKIINAAIRLTTYMRQQYTTTVKDLKAQSRRENELSEENEVLLKLLGKWKNLYQVSLKRVAQIYTKYHNFDIQDEVTEALISTLQTNITNLYIDASSNVSLLLKIFIVWSKYPVYLDYFLKFSEVIPSVVKIYSQIKAKKEVIEVVNQLLFSICQFGNRKEMELEPEDDDEKADITAEEAESASFKAKTILKKNVNVTISSIKSYFENQLSAKKHKVWKPNLKITKILVALSAFIEESWLCNDLLGLLQPLVDAQHINKAYDKRKRKENVPSPMTEKTIETLNGVLWIFANFFKHSTQQEKFYNVILDLLSNLYEKAPRESIVQMVQSLQLEKFNLSIQAIKSIEALNKYNRMSGRCLHYGTIVPVCAEINENLFDQCSFEDQQLVLYQYFFFLTQEELSLRMAATAGFKRFFEVVKQKQEKLGNESITKDVNWITKAMLPQLTKGLKGHKEYQIKANLEILDMYVTFMNSYVKNGLNLEQFDKAYYLDLKLLQNKTDLPQDFFDNIFDVQNYKRVKAVTILTKRLAIMNSVENIAEKKEEFLSMNTLKDVILPVLKFQILTKHLQEDVLKASGSQISHAKSLVTNMIEAYSMALKHFSWTQYFAVLKANVATLNKEAKYEKVVIRLLCANLNYLDGGLPNIVEEVTKEMNNKENDVEAESLMAKLVNYEAVRARELDGEETQEENKEIKDQEEKSNNENAMEIENEESKKEKAKISEMEVEIGTENVQEVNLEELERKEKEKKLKDEKVLQITQQLRKKILAPLRKHMHDLAAQENKERKIRVYTAVAITKLVCRFPFNSFNIEFPRLIHNICEALRSRDYDIRTNARKALTEIVHITGPYFFHYVVNEMKAVLNLGYQQHVKNYTLYYLLQSLIHPKGEDIQSIPKGSLDYCLPSILPVFVDEILGNLQEEKEVTEIKQKIPEFKTSKAYEAFQLLASVIDVKKTFVYLINFVKNQLQENSSTLKKCNKIEEILRNIVDGVSKNTSLDVELILIICFYLIEQSLDTMMIKDVPSLSEFTFQDYSLTKDDLITYNLQRTYLIQEGAASGKSIFKIMQQTQKKNTFIVGRIIASFSISLVQMCIKKSLIKPGTQNDSKQSSIIAKFEPLTKVIINCIKSNENSIITGSIKILNSIVTWPLNSLKKNYKKIVSSALTVLESLSMTDYDMIRVCFRLISNVFHIPANIQLTAQQTKILIQYIEQFLFVSDNIGEVLDCLATIIQKKIVRPEVYDLADKIVEALITNYSATIQRSSKNAFLTFLSDYPMTDKLIKKYIQLFVKNLDYSVDAGRAAVIETLGRIVELLPLELLQNYYDLILYSSIIKAISEENVELKNNLRKIGMNLIRRIPQEKIYEYAQNFLSWLNDGKEGVVQSGLEGFYLLISQGAHVDKHFKIILDKVSGYLTAIVEKINKYWQVLKQEIKRQKEQATIESKILKQLKEDNVEETRFPIENYESLCECLIRLVQVFSEKQGDFFSKYINTENNQLISVLFVLVTFPKEKVIVDCLGVLRILMEKIGSRLTQVFPTAESVFDQAGLKLVNMFKLDFATNDFEKGIVDTVLQSYCLIIKEEEKYIYTAKLLARLHKMLLRLMASANINAFRIKRIISFVHIIETTMITKGDHSGEILSHLVEIIVRVENIKDMFVGENDISHLVNELLETTRRKTETSEFIKVYSASKVKLDDKKRERKRQAKEEMLTHPEEALREKLRRKMKKKQAQKGVFGPKFAKAKKIKVD